MIRECKEKDIKEEDWPERVLIFEDGGYSYEFDEELQRERVEKHGEVVDLADDDRPAPKTPRSSGEPPIKRQKIEDNSPPKKAPAAGGDIIELSSSDEE